MGLANLFHENMVHYFFRLIFKYNLLIDTFFTFKVHQVKILRERKNFYDQDADKLHKFVFFLG